MNAATLSRDALIPRSPDGIGRGLGLATKGLAEIIDLQALLVSEPPPARALGR